MSVQPLFRAVSLLCFPLCWIAVLLVPLGVVHAEFPTYSSVVVHEHRAYLARYGFDPSTKNLRAQQVVDVMDLRSKQIVHQIPVAGRPSQMAVAGGKFFVIEQQRASVGVFDLQSFARLATLPIGVDGFLQSHPDGRRVVYGDTQQQRLFVIDAKTLQWRQVLYPRGLHKPSAMAISPDGKELYMSFDPLQPHPQSQGARDARLGVGSFAVYNFAKGRFQKRFALQGCTPPQDRSKPYVPRPSPPSVVHLYFSSDGREVVLGANTGLCRLDRTTNAVLKYEHYVAPSPAWWYPRQFLGRWNGKDLILEWTLEFSPHRVKAFHLGLRTFPEGKLIQRRFQMPGHFHSPVIRVGDKLIVADQTIRILDLNATAHAPKFWEGKAYDEF